MAGVDLDVHRKPEEIEAATNARTTFKLVAEDNLVSVEDRELAPSTLKKAMGFAQPCLSHSQRADQRNHIMIFQQILQLIPQEMFNHI